MKELSVRKNIRLKGYDYSREGCYFVTICVRDRREMLGRIKDEQLTLSKYGSVVKQEIEIISEIRKECLIEKYVVMPNHIHLIVRIVGDDGNRPAYTNVGDDGNRPAYLGECVPDTRADYHPPLRGSISNMVQGFKGAVTRKIGFSLWQRSYHDRVIRGEEEYQKIRRYIDENPARWQEDRYFVNDR